MDDIYDIKLILFRFIYSIEYIAIILIVIFLFLFYFLLKFSFKEKKEINIETKYIINNQIKKRLDYLIQNIELMSREIFYREVWMFLKFIIENNFDNNRVYSMTLTEIEKYFKTWDFDILKEVYFLEFNSNLEDSFEVRKNILEKIKV